MSTGGKPGAWPGRPRPQKAHAGPSAQTRAPKTRAPTPNSTSPEPVRLSKRMAELRMASRREADDWIGRGLVEVDGTPAVLGTKVPGNLPAARIRVRNEARREQSELVTILLHKPMGYVSGQAEDGYTPAVALINADSRWAECGAPTRFAGAHLRHLAVAGRLDIDSTGLLVLTQDGRIARQLIGEDGRVEKEYLVRVQPMSAPVERGGGSPWGEADVQSMVPESALAQLRHGLTLDGRPLREAQVEWVNPQQLRFVLSEGRKRQIRRMCELVGLRVTGLKRVRVGGVRLGNLPPGQWRYLREDEQF